MMNQKSKLPGRKQVSLSRKVSRMVLLGTLVLGLILMAVVLCLYAVAVANQYIAASFSLVRGASGVLSEMEDAEPLSLEVMGRYRSMTAEERAEVNTKAYAERFADLTERDDYRSIRTILGYFLESSDVYDLYLATYDRDTEALIYIADPDERDAVLPGYWERVDATEAGKFLSWNGEGMLYDIGWMEKYGWICTSGMPLKNSAGETFGFVLADTTLSGLVPRLTDFSLQYIIVMAVLILLFGWFMMRRTGSMLVRPINAIAKAARTYVKGKEENGRTDGSFSSLNITTGDEIENLAASMMTMEKDITLYEDRLARVSAEKERIGTELNLARRIQADMLPSIFPAFPDRQEIDIFATMKPAREVGGDFYDFFFVDQDRLALVIADVSGKGIPAAMFMMMAKNMIQTQAASGKPPHEVLEKVNRLICRNNQETMFVTVWFAVLDLKTGILTASNAGHEYPVLKRPDGCFEVIRDRHGFVIGGFPDVKFSEYEIRMEVGSKLFVYTDGVPEATSADHAFFGLERTVEALNSAKDGSPQEILRTVNSAVEHFAGDAEQFDDLTMMCIEYRGIGKNHQGTHARNG